MTHPPTKPSESLAIIGSGASSIYLLKHLLDEIDCFKSHLSGISIFEKGPLTGMGMPYSPHTTDRYNMSNISSEELPELPETFADWLRAQDASTLKEIDMEGVEISESEVYNRLALGRYLNAQYRALVEGLSKGGIPVHEHPDCEIKDIDDRGPASGVTLTTSKNENHEFGKVIVATGHHWADEDKPEQGYYASPWPISKLLPTDGEKLNFAIGTLGASLSAFDVIASLAHRHGHFTGEKNGLRFHPDPGTEDFKIVMHSSQGLLPHLQFDQDEPFREIYRHVDRERLLELIDDQGFLRLETYFDQVCRPALRKAFKKDNQPEMVQHLDDPQFGLRDFVEKMADKHDYDNAFEGMRHEMPEAKQSVEGHQPIHWKEIIDDLFYTLNFHAGLMPAEDHLLLHSLVMPFLMNVIAAMPLPSGNTILALYDAGKLEIVSGMVSIDDEQNQPGETSVTVNDEGEESKMSYRMFIDCSGQKPLELEDYPFASLVKNGAARKARAHFHNPEKAIRSLPEEKKEHLFEDGEETVLHIGGIDIDSDYRLIGVDGKANPRIYDIAFPHTSGLRPYSYGLQACSATAFILVKSWAESLASGSAPEVTEIYEEV